MRTKLKEYFEEGPSKHVAKQKAFVTVPAWSVHWLLRAGKAPSSIGGLFLPLKTGEAKGTRGVFQSLLKRA